VRDKGSGSTAGAASASKAANQVHRSLSIDSTQELGPQIRDFFNGIDPSETSSMRLFDHLVGALLEMQRHVEA
jgi:hypothetical protein